MEMAEFVIQSEDNVAVVGPSTANKGNDAMQPFAIVGGSSTHIDSTMGVLETRGNDWQ